MNTEATCMIRSAEWRDIGNKLRDMARMESHDMNDWLMDQAKIAWARCDEATAIAKEIRKQL